MTPYRRTFAPLGVIAGMLLASCGSHRIADLDGVYYGWDERRVLCGVTIDDALSDDFVPSLSNLRQGLERARDRDEVLILYAHEPGDDVSVERLASVLDLIDEVGVDHLTFDELAGEPRGAGVALTFDDAHIDAWHGQRALFTAHGARVTFFVSNFHRLSSRHIGLLHELYADGHAIESHGMNHLHGPDYVEEHGLRAYVVDEVLPSLEAMRAAGFAPTTFAYPFGARTGDLDQAVLQHVTLVRSLSWIVRTPLIADPCPE